MSLRYRPNFNDLIGLPWQDEGMGPDGYFCYGLWIEVCKRLGLPCPDYKTVPAAMCDVIHNRIEGIRWAFERVDQGEPGDAVLIQLEPGVNNHIGVVIAPGVFLQALKGIGVHRSMLKNPLYRDRIEGIYRYVGA